jgi:hypothetical protein
MSLDAYINRALSWSCRGGRRIAPGRVCPIDEVHHVAGAASAAGRAASVSRVGELEFWTAVSLDTPRNQRLNFIYGLYIYAFLVLEYACCLVYKLLL